MLPETEIPRIIPRYDSGVPGDSALLFPLCNSPDSPRDLFRRNRPAEFVRRYEAGGKSYLPSGHAECS